MYTILFSAVLQYHRQQELLSSLLKQQQHTAQNVSQSTLLQRRQRPSTKEIPLQQTLGLPTLGISPRQSPLPSDVSSAISSQGRIPSPLGLSIVLFYFYILLNHSSKIIVLFSFQIKLFLEIDVNAFSDYVRIFLLLPCVFFNFCFKIK